MFYALMTREYFISEFTEFRPNNFSFEGLNALYDYFEEMGEEMDIQFDLIAIAVEYEEFDSLEAFQSNYGPEYETMEDIEYQTEVIYIGGSDGFIIREF
jgi:hypothetical protein